MNVLITGAAGNLGSLLARHILDHQDGLNLLLMQHKKPVRPDIARHPRVKVRFGDLSRPDTLDSCLDGAHVIVHFAGVLFKANPEKFLPTTNLQYFKNLVDAANKKCIPKVILISFPHVEGPTSIETPATGRLDRFPVSMHAQTRLEEEKYLFGNVDRPVSLRVGMVYGKGVLMVDAAKWFAKRRLLCVWEEPTQIHLISKTDFCRATTAAVVDLKADGIYHIGDEGEDTLQSFLDFSCRIWRYPQPWRVPVKFIYFAAKVFELVSKIFHTASPLTRDFIDIGRVSYYGDTTRFRNELLPELRYRNISSGVDEML